MRGVVAILLKRATRHRATSRDNGDANGLPEQRSLAWHCGARVRLPSYMRAATATGWPGWQCWQGLREQGCLEAFSASSSQGWQGPSRLAFSHQRQLTTRRLTANATDASTTTQQATAAKGTTDVIQPTGGRRGTTAAPATSQPGRDHALVMQTAPPLAGRSLLELQRGEPQRGEP